MDAKWNWFIDNVPIRVTINTLAFAVWMVAATVWLYIA
jgi:hypothetical protein